MELDRTQQVVHYLEHKQYTVNVITALISQRVIKCEAAQSFSNTSNCKVTAEYAKAHGEAHKYSKLAYGSSNDGVISARPSNYVPINSNQQHFYCRHLLNCERSER